MNFADALTGGVMAASDSAPMVLVNNNASSLSKATSDYLGSVGAKRVVVFGGRSAVSDQVVRLINQAAGL
jgi:putative cell wall-binding protein